MADELNFTIHVNPDETVESPEPNPEESRSPARAPDPPQTAVRTPDQQPNDPVYEAKQYSENLSNAAKKSEAQQEARFEKFQSSAKGGYGMLAGAAMPDMGGMISPLVAGVGNLVSYVGSFSDQVRGMDRGAKEVEILAEAARLAAEHLEQLSAKAGDPSVPSPVGENESEPGTNPASQVADLGRVAEAAAKHIESLGMAAKQSSDDILPSSSMDAGASLSPSSSTPNPVSASRGPLQPGAGGREQGADAQKPKPGLGKMAKIGIAAGAAAIGFVAVRAAARAVVSSFEELIDRNKQYSAELAIAAAQSRVDRIQDQLRQADRLGPGLAKVASSSSDFQTAWSEAKTTFMEPMVDSTSGLLDSFTSFVEATTPILSVLGEAMSWIIDIFSGIIETISYGIKQILEFFGVVIEDVEAIRNKDLGDNPDKFNIIGKLQAWGNQFGTLHEGPQLLPPNPADLNPFGFMPNIL